MSVLRKVGLLVLISLMVASAGCIRQEGGAIILSFGNETYTFTYTNQTNTTAPAPSMHVYEEEIQVGQSLLIKELNFTITPDYDPIKAKFFFITTNGVYWEPMNITLEDGTNIVGEEYWVGATAYVAKITITSPQELTLIITTPVKNDDTNTPAEGG